jgi:protein phosphatase
MLARFDPHVADPIRLLEEGFRAAQAAVSQHPGVGATCIAAIVRGQRVWLGHVGDCRAYTERFGDLRRRTEDHSLVAREVALGRLDPAAARHHPHANILLRALGEGGDGAAELSEFGLPHGERLLLCTDGLHATLDDEAIGATLRVQPNAHAAVSAVHDAVLIAGAPDNVAAILVDTSR